MSESLKISSEILESITVLFAQAELPARILSGVACTQGKNNRTYQITTTEGPYIVKQYLRQAADQRDRLASEFVFLSYAKQVAAKAVPAPIYQDPEQSMAIYEFVEGCPLRPQDVTKTVVDEAADFFCALNEPVARAKAKNLPRASEACFSIQEHLDLISARIEQLKKIEIEFPEDEKACSLVARLSHSWEYLTAELVRANLDCVTPLEAGQRCISPSDFGFHNALRRKDGKLCFVDFEYAGWDDPAKMTGDFFSQLALPVSGDLFAHFVQKVMQPFSSPEALIYRAHCLRLVYRVKWCCIALNSFLSSHLARYRFSNPSLDIRDFKWKQVLKAETLIQSLESCYHGLP